MLAAYSSGPAPTLKTTGYRVALASLTSRPRVAQASAASVAMPAELLTIPIRRPRGSGWLSNSWAASNIASPLWNR